MGPLTGRQGMLRFGGSGREAERKAAGPQQALGATRGALGSLRSRGRTHEVSSDHV